MATPTRTQRSYLTYDKIQNLKFGGMTTPGLGGTYAYVDLNDGAACFAQDIEIEGKHILNSLAQFNWQASAAWTGLDFVGRKIRIPIIFDTAVTPWSTFAAQLSQAGTQFLTMDGGVTGIRARINDLGNQKLYNHVPGYLIETTLEFYTQNPFAEDIAGESSQTFTGLSTTYNTCTIAYQGNVFTRPRVVINIPAVGTYSRVDFSNQGENVDVAITSFSGGGAHTVSIDSAKQQCFIDATEFGPVGTFPSLYPGTNNMGVNIFNSSAVSGISATIYFVNKWEYG